MPADQYDDTRCQSSFKESSAVSGASRVGLTRRVAPKVKVLNTKRLNIRSTMARYGRIMGTKGMTVPSRVFT